jgi:DNA (cytosine-5)-methyltransferase 1
MKHGSLFSGIGGFDLAAEWMRWNNVFHCEWNEFGQKILKHYWPKAISYGDITKTDFTIHRGTVDILTGGFPCQPYSLAGKRKGKEDDRHLWPEMLRAIHEIQPAFVVGENVPGLINWSGGLVFEEVQSQMEIERYEVIPFVLPACGVNAPHKRERIWFIAHSKSVSCRNGTRNDKHRTQVVQEKRLNEHISTSDPGLQRPQIRQEQTAGIKQCDGGNVANTANFRQKSTGNTWDRRAGFKNSNQPDATDTGRGIRKNRLYGEKQEWKTGEFRNSDQKFNSWSNFPTQSPLCSRDDGFSSQLDGITFPKWRNESIKAMGNAIVPQVAFQIFKAIEEFQIMSEEVKT